MIAPIALAIFLICAVALLNIWVARCAPPPADDPDEAARDNQAW